MRPAEWQKNKTIFLAWPFDEAIWGHDLLGAQKETLSLIAALKDERLVVVVPNESELKKVAGAIGKQPRLSFMVMRYGDIWLRDTFPIFVKGDDGLTRAVIPRFNGWGHKFWFRDDMDLSTRAKCALGVEKITSNLVFEGGAIDCDGNGTLLTTEHCLLNKNRNPKMSKEAIGRELSRLFGVTKTIWLTKGLINDHTDSHVDTIARFIGPALVAIMTPRGRSDPNYRSLLSIKAQLAFEADAQSRPLKLVEIPSPGAVVDRNNKLLPASYLNFIMGDRTLIVPVYGTPYDQEAVDIFKRHVNLNVIGLSARSILSGGGAFHCMSQEFYR